MVIFNRIISVITIFANGFFILSALIAPLESYAKQPSQPGRLSIEDLQNLEVSSVSKKNERAFDAPAAVFVLTQEDIRRSGASSIPEALRLVPGLQVARAGANQWAISARGFNDQFSNKLLVMINGRTVYTPLFSGVFWDAQDLLLEDIKQIEVVKGPGATLWGANAVNGVINIITEDVVNTQDSLATVTAGTQDRMIAAYRRGGKIKDDMPYRVYGKWSIKDNLTSDPDHQESRFGTGGFSVEWLKSEYDQMALQSDVYSGTENQKIIFPSLIPPYTSTSYDNEELNGGNALVRWKHQNSGGSSITLQSYIDYYARNISYLEQKILTYDVDFQQSLPLMKSNEVTWGAGYRLVHDDLEGSSFISYDPDSLNYGTLSGFVQDKIHLVPETLFLTLGTKIEHNYFSGFELQPSVRLSWLPNDINTLWGSISRAVRVPNRNMNDVTFNALGTPSGFFQLQGNTAADSEKLIAYELGFRTRALPKTTFDIATFFNDYDQLISNQFTGPLSAIPANTSKGHSYGFEVSLDWDVTDNWKLKANYSLLKLHLEGGTSAVTTEGKSPKNQFSISSIFDIKDNIEFNNYLYYVDSLDAIGIDNYMRFDSIVTWKPKHGVEFSLIGSNLLDERHPEFSPFIYSSQTEVGRAVSLKTTLQF